MLDGRCTISTAIRELRELARGIHPAVLSERGLASALDALAQRLPLPVEIGPLPPGRLPEPVEAAVYFVIAEALTNVTRYADATHARVELSVEGDAVDVRVIDDGIGGADSAKGSGLRGLTDRVAALDGHLDVESEPGRGTTVRARIPGVPEACATRSLLRPRASTSTPSLRVFVAWTPSAARTPRRCDRTASRLFRDCSVGSVGSGGAQATSTASAGNSEG
jgi:signal transduction histidine kinase